MRQKIMYRITVTKDGFYQLLELTEKYDDFKKYDDCVCPTKYLVVVYGYDFDDMCKYYPDTHILRFGDYDKTFELVEQICDQVLEIEFLGGGGSMPYMIFIDKQLSSFQNIVNFFIREGDAFSVKSNKLLFYANANYNYQEHNPDLIDASDNSMKSLFEETNFEAIEYATVMINGIIKDNYYYSLEWLDKMTNLKRLNLILGFNNDHIDQFIEGLKIPKNVELIIKSK